MFINYSDPLKQHKRSNIYPIKILSWQYFEAIRTPTPPGLAMEPITGIAHEPHARVPGFSAEAQRSSALRSAPFLRTVGTSGKIVVFHGDFMRI